MHLGSFWILTIFCISLTFQEFLDLMIFNDFSNDHHDDYCAMTTTTTTTTTATTTTTNTWTSHLGSSCSGREFCGFWKFLVFTDFDDSDELQDFMDFQISSNLFLIFNDFPSFEQIF